MIVKDMFCSFQSQLRSMFSNKEIPFSLWLSHTNTKLDVNVTHKHEMEMHSCWFSKKKKLQYLYNVHSMLSKIPLLIQGKKPSKMDVAPWDEHWIQMVLDGIWWYWMVLLSSVFICFHRSFYCFYQFYLFSSFLICFFKCTPLWEYHLFEILTCWYDKSVKSVQNLYPQTIQLLESPIPTTTTSTTSQKASSHLTQVAISRESSVVA